MIKLLYLYFQRICFKNEKDNIYQRHGAFAEFKGEFSMIVHNCKDFSSKFVDSYKVLCC